MWLVETIVVTWLLLFLGDFLSTFCYHIPEHVFGQLHLQTHHASHQTFRHYAVLIANSLVLLDGLLGALPYLVVGGLLWSYSPIGVLLGLLLGQIHVWWRHTTALGWQTPKPIIRLCDVLLITTPERHWIHHRRMSTGYGDIFTCFEYPAKTWFRWLRLLRLRWRDQAIFSTSKLYGRV